MLKLRKMRDNFALQWIILAIVLGTDSEAQTRRAGSDGLWQECHVHPMSNDGFYTMVLGRLGFPF